MLFFLKVSSNENDSIILYLFSNENRKIKKGNDMKLDCLRIKAERIAKCMTQDDMAKELGWNDRGF